MKHNRSRIYGKAISHPFRVDAGGAVALSEGRAEQASVLMEYLRDAEKAGRSGNSIAEAVRRILDVRVGEYDVIPWYGSQVKHLLFNPNTLPELIVFEHWLAECVKRWEHRVAIRERTATDPGSVQWERTPDGVDIGELGLTIQAEFSRQQAAANLVFPFTSPRAVRLAEYPSDNIDENGHDGLSRYKGAETYTQDGRRLLRITPRGPIPPEPDDIVDTIRARDNWWTVSYRNYGEIRYWHWPYWCWVFDAGEDGMPSDSCDPRRMPDPGTEIRMPSQERILMRLAA